MKKKKQIKKEALEVQAFEALQRSLWIVSSDVYDFLLPINMTGSQFGVLESLYTTGSKCQCDLADQIFKTSGNVTTVIDNLEKKGLVERVKGEKDRRYFLIVLTPEGKKLIKSLHLKYTKRVKQVMAKLTQTDQKHVNRICHKFIDAD